MPELPEVETVVRRLRLPLTGRKIRSVKILSRSVLQGPPSAFLRQVTGSIIREIRRKGKFILFVLDPPGTMILHLKMTGQVFIEPQSAAVDRHSHLLFRFDDSDIQLRYRDVRKFGFFQYEPADRPESLSGLRRIGPDPFETTCQKFTDLIQSKRRNIKSFLLDQTMISGLGNIYVDEALFQSGLHPLTQTGVLSKSQIQNLFRIIKKILKRAITAQGSTLRDYRKPDGTSGGFQNYHQVYGRTAEPCPICGFLIKKIRVAGRGTHFCPSCQKLGPSAFPKNPFLRRKER
ncbi:MAG: bifunctional DNA-formamidopyrimidine glycosylase/DNA-(apurinic or apyrimidinic site) lyase [Thermodesulfobacteriota bacterium]